ncbi:MAG: hypothetical protein CL569_05050 [Alphaproteobacteria bacterium]|nr:hypothetical protein [Alphaproteobacteria bacterium]|tara:strand:+ start:72 stop:401 length:330 start_codon:yes stop_codon:yes gene_type:complete
MTKRQFNSFKRVFKAEQKRLNLNEYTVSFRLKKLRDCWACIEADPEGCVAVVEVNDTTWQDAMVESTAKHEAIHLLLARLVEIGGRRFADEAEFRNEEERVVSLLEKLL